MNIKKTSQFKIPIIASIILFITVVKLSGIRILSVKSNSMYPYLNKYDLLVTQPADNYKIGDVITFESHNSLITHRIIEIKEDYFTTKGDYNSYPDSRKIEKKFIVGRMLIRVYLGFLYLYVSLCFITAYLAGCLLKFTR